MVSTIEVVKQNVFSHAIAMVIGVNFALYRSWTRRHVINVCLIFHVIIDVQSQTL